MFDRLMRVEHWQNAIKQGAAAGRNMIGKRIAHDDVHGSGRTNTMRICGTRDFTRRGANSLSVAVWTPVGSWPAT